VLIFIENRGRNEVSISTQTEIAQKFIKIHISHINFLFTKLILEPEAQLLRI